MLQVGDVAHSCVPGRGKKSAPDVPVTTLPSSSEASSVADAGAATPSSLRDGSSIGVSLQSSATPPAALRGPAGNGGATDTSQSVPSDGRAPAVLAETGSGSASDTDASVEGGRRAAAVSLSTATSRRLRRAASSGLSGSAGGASAQQPAVAADGSAGMAQPAELREDPWPPTEEVLRMALHWLQGADEVAVNGAGPTLGAGATHPNPLYLSVHKVAALLAGVLQPCAWARLQGVAPFSCSLQAIWRARPLVTVLVAVRSLALVNRLF